MNLKNLQNILSDDGVLTLFSVLFFLMPGFAALYLYQITEFYSLDFLKLMMLSAIYTLPSFLAVAISGRAIAKDYISEKDSLWPFAVIAILTNSILFLTLLFLEVVTFNFTFKSLAMTYYLLNISVAIIATYILYNLQKKKAGTKATK